MENLSTKVELLLGKVDQLNEEEFDKMVDSLTPKEYEQFAERFFDLAASEVESSKQSRKEILEEIAKNKK